MIVTYPPSSAVEEKKQDSAVIESAAKDTKDSDTKSWGKTDSRTVEIREFFF